MRKLILPIFVVLSFLLAGNFSVSPAFAFLGLGESSSEFDCQKFWESFSEQDQLAIVGTQQLGSKWQLTSDKNMLQKKNSDYCELKGQQFDTDSEGELRNGFEINISYFQNQEEAGSKLGSLKTSESVKVDDKNIPGDTYSMRTLNVRNEEGGWTTLLPGNYGRTVGRVGNCVVSLTQTWYALANQWNTGGEYDKQAGLMDIIMEGTKAGWQFLSESKDLQQFCGGKADGNQEKASQPQQPKSDQTGQTGQAAKSADQKYDIGKKIEKENSPLNLFNINPLETLRNIQALLQIPQGLNDLIETGEFLAGTKEIPIIVPEPAIATDSEGKPWNFLPGYIPHESIDLGKSVRLLNGSKIATGGVDPGSGKKFLDLKAGAVEVIKNEPDLTDSGYDGIRTPNGTVISIQTHYWVSYDKKKNQTAVAVYEGKVEVRTKDGQKIIVSPNGDKPGVVAIAQKLSVTKIAIGGLILIGAIGGSILILRRKLSSKVLNKKKK